MAKEIVWSYEAVTDLEELAEYIGRDSLFYASAFIREVIQVSRSLKNFSGRGRVVPELKKVFIREIFVGEFRLIYSIEKTRVVILGFIHGRRDLGKI